jgi:hypothetical protein
MVLAPREQHALLRMERSLGKDPAVRAALGALNRRSSGQDRFTPECTSPWRPVLWRAASIGIVGLTVAFVAACVIVALTQA